MYHSLLTRAGLIGAAAIALAGCSSSTAPRNRASFVIDPIGDFIPSFDGTRGADLDAKTMEVSYDGTMFDFNATVVGTVGTTPGGVYVWGVNRDSGTARFGSIATGVLFDLVVIVKPGGISSVRDFNRGTATDLPVGAVTITGSTIDVKIPASLLPPQGYAPEQFTSNFWPRTGLVSNNQISDFAPDNSNAPVRLLR